MLENPRRCDTSIFGLSLRFACCCTVTQNIGRLGLEGLVPEKGPFRDSWITLNELASERLGIKAYYDKDPAFVICGNPQVSLSRSASYISLNALQCSKIDEFGKFMRCSGCELASFVFIAFILAFLLLKVYSHTSVRALVNNLRGNKQIIAHCAKSVQARRRGELYSVIVRKSSDMWDNQMVFPNKSLTR